MHPGKTEVKRRVWVGLTFALLATGGWWGWTRLNAPEAGKPESTKPPFVRLAGAGKGLSDRILREQAELFDPAPLFFPTEWNFGQNPIREAVRRQPGQVFGSFEAKLVFADQKIKSYGFETAAVPERLSDVLAQGNEAPFAGIGQVDVERPPLLEREGFLEVRKIGSSQIVIKKSLSGINLPRSGFSPLEFIVVISSAGIVGEPVLMGSSDFDEVDAFFRSYLTKGFHLGERLTPGLYRILVGP